MTFFPIKTIINFDFKNRGLNLINSELNEDYMNIIIVGCGKVGYTIAEQLCKEGHDVTVIDERADVVNNVKNNLDVIAIHGNGVSNQVLSEAGIKSCHLFIAVSGSDEHNLLSCIVAKKNSKCNTIARVRNPIYEKELDFLKEEFDLASIINPEYETADEISRIFQFPSATKINRFVGGNVDQYRIRITESSPLNGEKIMNIRTHYNKNILISGVLRNDEFLIPGGNFILEKDDLISIVASRKDARDFLKKTELLTNPVKNVCIAGGGKISFYLAKKLISASIGVKIIESNEARANELAEIMPEATIIHADATDPGILEEEGIENVQGFAALTGLDEENILVTLYARKNSKAKIITKINRINFNSVISELHLDSVINPRMITADRITRYARTMNAAVNNNNVETLYSMDEGKAEALEFKINTISAITGCPIKDLKLKPNSLICSISRKHKTIIPSGNDTINVGDLVVVVTAGYKISDITEILED